MQMPLGPNMRRIRELEGADSVEMRVTGGPGDILLWEVRAAVERSGMRLDMVGRGPDLEAAAAELMRLLKEHGAKLEPTNAGGQPTGPNLDPIAPETIPPSAFEVAWVQDETGRWHGSTHPVGYLESTSPWVLTTACGQRIETEVPPSLQAPADGELCPDCDAAGELQGSTEH